ncbi:Serine/threonine-protein kinase srk1 [Psilocybe cubensis]|uniref:Serine/threonine-protein kinase srk1 n=1 Tax=Psilocybe cubensis TaxID=181762 RepID=A0ACB8H5C5_PSICU|nr:Serine/threonine-protein kinase srk1 [Psilocybe cubensis]KAH9482847.1 Serine/threonine-protein kinase srk1 [Psilocybe cubensis]
MPPGVIHAFKSLIRHGKHHAEVAKHDNHISQVPPDPSPEDTDNSRGLRHNVHNNHHPDNQSKPMSPPAREVAEQIVDEERKAKAKMPSYKGLENFRLEDKMGDGAFSNVYRAVDLTSGKKVAIKVVRKYELNSSQRANILKEVQIIRGTSHPSIVKLYSFSESEEYYYLVMELMEGGELFHQIVKLTYFSENLARHVILQVARGIRYLHEERGVVHRDIKPENLLFERIPIIPSKNPIHRPYDEEKEDEGEFIPGVGGGGIGRVKIADFGLSKVVWNEETMTPCGTVGYTAPEIVKDERYSKSVDMWALGCVLYTLLCGFPPFYDESINVLTEKVARGYYTFLSPWWDDISHSAKDLISHLLCVDPAQRYTIDEFLNHPWCNAAPAPAPPATPYTYGNLKDPLSNQPLDSPLLSAARGGRIHEGRSPGIATLKEAFDITYAVHRMEEEGARRRKYNGRGGAGTRGFLTNLNEDDEEETEYGSEETSDDEAAQRRYQQNAAEGQQAHIPHASVMEGRAGQRDQGGRGRVITAAGAGQPDPTQSKTRTPGRSRAAHKGFELDLDGATLLGRRGKRAVGVSSPLKMEGLHVNDERAGSPMHL